MPTIADIAELLQAPVRGGNPREPITGIASLEQASAEQISYMSAESYLKKFSETAAAAVIISKRIKLPSSANPALIVVDDVELAVAKVLALFAPPVPRPPTGIDPTARVADDARIDPTAAIGPLVAVGTGSQIGARTVIHPGTIIGAGVAIGDDCEIFPNVVIRERVTIGSRVIINAGSVLGTDGFGYRWDGSRHFKIPQIGTIVIEDDVELGSCVCVDRAKMGVTRVGRGTKIDNLVQVAHNVVIGPHCIIVGQVGLAGSVTLGSGVVLGGQTAVRDHITLGDGAMAAARSAIHEDVDPGMTVSGMPALPHRQSLREQAAMRRLPDLVTQVRKLQEEVQRLKEAREK